MKRGRFVLRIVLTCAVVVVAAVLLWPREREPVYQGKKLSEWLPDYNFDPTSERHVRADGAIRHIGTNALPFLLNWINYKDAGIVSHPRRVYNDFQHAIGRGPFWEDGRKERAYQAAHAIATLGPEAKAAVPLLSGMLNADGDRSFLAANALAHLGTNGLPALLAALTNASIKTRKAATNALHKIAPEVLENAGAGSGRN